MLRILHVVPDMNSGGIENYIMNMYRRINRDIIQFDFLVHHADEGFFDREITSLGGNIYRIPVLDDYNLLKYKNALKELFASERFSIVHGHAASLAFFYLGVAEKVGVPFRIVHSHGTSHLNTPKGYAKKFLFKGAKTHANIRLACSTEAGKYLFGNTDFFLARNAIEAERFKFDIAAREEVRADLCISDDEIVLGHIGRFNLQKNHSLLVDVFAEYHKSNPKSILLLVGKGELKDKTAEKITSLGLDEDVRFVDVTSVPEKYYSAMDVFALPSLFEGLPLAGVEAQCSGLPCVFSSAITREVEIGGQARYVDLSEDPRKWVQEIEDLTASLANRSECWRLGSSAGFDVNANTKLMESFYLRLANGEDVTL